MSVKLTNEARVELRASLKIAIAEAGESDAITPAMVNAAPKAELLAWASRFGVTLPAMATAPIDDVELEASGIEADGVDTVDPIEALALADVAELQRHIAVMDGQAFKSKALELARLAHKPAEIRTIEVEAPAADGTPKAPRVIASKARKDTLKNLFGVTGPLGRLAIDVWHNGSHLTELDPHYVWPEQTGNILAAAFHRGRNVFLVGPAGTGKTSLVEQISARLGRPFFRLSMHGQIEAAEIMGQRIITADQGMIWADGLLSMAMQVPGAIILIDEVDRARTGMVTALQSVLDRGQITFPETGHTIKMAEGVRVFLAGNTNGTGDSTGQYTAAQQLDRATLDRCFTVRVDYLPADREASLLVNKTGCPQTLADLLVHFAGVTRLDVAKGELPHAVGFRPLYTIADMLTLGADPQDIIQAAILNTVGVDEVEKLSLLLKTHLSPTVIRRALKGEQVIAPATTAGRGAQDFTPIAE